MLKKKKKKLRKTMMNKNEDHRSLLAEFNEEMMFSDGFDDALIGVCHQFGRPPVAAYDYEKCIGILVKRDGMSYQEAVEFFEFNVSGAWVGESTPVFIETVTSPTSITMANYP
jgi:hypothetical protein